MVGTQHGEVVSTAQEVSQDSRGGELGNIKSGADSPDYPGEEPSAPAIPEPRDEASGSGSPDYHGREPHATATEEIKKESEEPGSIGSEMNSSRKDTVPVVDNASKVKTSTVGYSKESNIIDKYQQEIMKLQRELSCVKEQYVMYLTDKQRSEGLLDIVTYQESAHKLDLEMCNLEAASRGKVPKHAVTPAMSAARHLRVSQLESSVYARTSAAKLMSLEQTLRSTEAACNVLRVMEQEGEKAGGLQPVVNPKCHAQRTMAEPAVLEPLDDEHFRVWLDPLIHAEDLFLKKLFTADTAYKATAMKLRLEDADRNQAEVLAVVDSGAAWSAIDEKTLRAEFPSVLIEPSDRQFKNASGHLMSVVGKVDLTFKVGDLRLRTVVYVFSNLGATFLLGVNSLVENGLAVSTQRRVLFSEHPDATSASHEPLSFCHAITSDCVECADEQSTPPSMQLACNCAVRNEYMLTCDVDTQKLMVQLPNGKTQEAAFEPIKTEGVVAPSRKKTPPTYRSVVRTTRSYRLTKARPFCEVRLEYDEHCAGDVVDLNVTVTPEFEREFGDKVQYTESQLHSSLNRSAPFLVSLLPGQDSVLIPTGTVVGTVTTGQGRRDEPTEACTIESATELVLRTVDDPPASPLEWRVVEQPPEAPVTIGDLPIVADRALKAPDLASRLTESTLLTREEWDRLKPASMRPGRLHMSHHVVCDDGTIFRPVAELPFEEGGRPRTRADLNAIGLDLEQCIDPSGVKDADGNYPPLSEEQKEMLYSIALKWQCVWSRDSKTPELSRLVVIDIPTGDVRPIAQKPYPLPYKYLDAVRKEVQKLLDGGLIEPCISNWASPVLVRLKKDSKPDEIRLKIICDYRRLNEVTIPDAAGLGSQEEILHGFGGNQRFVGICDAAGGFYQFLIKPSDRHKTAWVLPTSMGGTSFQWRVAPYGLTRNPAGYSRGMMFALKGLSSCQLTHGTGGAGSWIDDVSMHADSFLAFAELFELILTRIAFAGMSLKAEKTYLLQQRTEVLGYYVTPDGLIMQEDKLKDLRNRFDKDGKPMGPTNVKEVRTFLGAVQFYRRFVPRLALLAAPMNALLKKYPDGDARNTVGSPAHKAMMEGVQQSYEAIMMFLQSSAVVAAPDFQDPLAEFVICPDACDIGAGGVLLQWQWPVHGQFGPGPPPGTPVRGGKGGDPLTQSWRLDAGWKLRTIEFYSKTFDSAQQNYPTFDKEAAAILLCCRRWAQLITCHPTTVYTDSAVAASMLTKHLGPPRLQRWGMELGTFLPYLKIQYRAGILNGIADFLSRFPTFERYVFKPSDAVTMPDGLDDVAEVPLFTHELSPEENRLLKNWKYTLRESPTPALATAIWHGDADAVNLVDPEPHDEAAERRQAELVSMATEVGKAIAATPFWREQAAFDEELHDWDEYVNIFCATHGRMPVVYDFFCGEGGYSRGARAVGCECHGFDNTLSCRTRYEWEPAVGCQPSPSCMTFHHADVLAPTFWEELMSGRVNGKPIPPPDIVHASPPCAVYTRVAAMRNAPQPQPPASSVSSIDELVVRLEVLEKHLVATHHKPLLWQIENVPESRHHVHERVPHTATLCGTMMGHQVFRHRVIYSNYPLVVPQRHDHGGKCVGERGVRGNAEFNSRFANMPAPNMYGVYSKPYAARGTSHEWHGSLGALPGTYSNRGLAGCLPTGYGRLTASQMIAHSLHREFGCPVWPQHELQETERACLQRWANEGYQKLRVQANPVEQICGQEEATTPAPRPSVRSAVPESVTPQPFEGFDLPDEPFDTLFTISRNAQMADPDLAAIVRTLEDTKNARKPLHATLHSRFAMQSGLLYKKDFSHADVRHLLVVPESRRAALMRHYHYSNHRGHNVLRDQLTQSYWWPRLPHDCEDFTAACSVCGRVRSGGVQKVPDQPMPTPSQPFSVIHVDHKGPLPPQPGCKFTNILVVVCALTRFTLFIPVINVTAEETLRQLVARVFCVFGTPAVIVSDNGPAFLSDLSAAAAKFYGYRHIHTLPYNPQANGVAEASVKRIKLLLDRQTKDYAEWHKLLPLAQHMLNTTVHTSTGLTPFEAVFGREPVGLEKLENPALYPDGDGDEFLSSIKKRMLHLHKSLREASDTIKHARIATKDRLEHSRLEKARLGTVLPSTPTHNRYVWLLYGSPENAAYIRKHGHGAPWKHRYKVLEVKPHAVRLEVPKDGSVPRVMEWQPMRRVCVARDNEHGPTGDEPYLTEHGLAASPEQTQSATGEKTSGDLDGDSEEVYDIERVVRADRVGNRYKIWLKWRGHVAITPRWRHELVLETSNTSLLKEIEDAVQAARERHRAEHGYLEEDSDDDADVVQPNLVAPQADACAPADAPLDERALRRARRAARISLVEPVRSLLSTVSQYVSRMAQSSLLSFKAVCDDYCVPSRYV